MASVRGQRGSRAASTSAANSGIPNEYSNPSTSTVMWADVASASPGLSEVANVNVAAVCSTEVTRSGRPMFAMTARTHLTGHSSTGAPKYQTTNASGSHTATFSRKRPSGVRMGYAGAGGAAGAPGSVRTQTSQTISTSSMIN